MLCLFLILLKRQPFKGRLILDEVCSHLPREETLAPWAFVARRLIEGKLRHVIKLLKELLSRKLVIRLEEDFELVLLSEMAHFNFYRFFECGTKLPFNRIDHHRARDFPWLLGLDVQLNDIGRFLSGDDPKEEFKAPIVVLAVDGIRVSLIRRKVAVRIAVGLRLRMGSREHDSIFSLAFALGLGL